MAKKKPLDKRPKDEKSSSKRVTRDFSQRAYDAVRDVEKRHVERQKDDRPE
jgi:hypothetical protein